MPAKCNVIGCNKPTCANGLCNTHYMRVRRHGTSEQTRAKDWGKREKHPAYSSWCNLRRHHGDSIPTSWYEDFWQFVADTPEHPGPLSQAFRSDPAAPWSKDNFYWKEPRNSKEYRDDRAAYMRDWHRQSREANPEYYRDADRKKLYGVPAGWYAQKFAEQDGLCAICRQPETTKIRGKTISLSVDHCHGTKEVRGLLCRPCNQAIGGLKHDPELLKNAITSLSQGV